MAPFLIQSIVDVALNILFPKLCIACEKEGELLCNVCSTQQSQQIQPATIQISPTLSVYAADTYQSTITKSLIRAVKYRGIKEAHSLCANLLVQLYRSHIQEEEVNQATTILIPVPLHKSRLRKRGYNQSQLLAEYMAKELTIAIDSSSLKRTSFKISQMKLSKKERVKNVQGAFAYTGPSLTGKTIILIDDVCTTGSTLRECANALSQAKPQKIIAMTVAHEPLT
jgi:ComF family protein